MIIVDEMLAVGDMMRACITYKRYMDDVIRTDPLRPPFTISAQRAQELLEAADLLRQALALLEPAVQARLAHALQTKTPISQ
ncbi:hypothetical protein PS663_03745 [Pseudomonas fluorescens]|nr:hypothetical protein PS663_03745 [Pseudomonas fluorescens]